MLKTWLRATTLAAAAAAVLVVGGLLPTAGATGAVQVSGSGPVATGDQCTSDDGYGEKNAPAGVAPLFFDEGDLLGCYYTDTSDPRVSAVGGGRFRLVDRGTETFVGTLRGDEVRFRSSFVIIAEFQGNPLEDPGASLISGFCHHPLIEGGKGVLHFVDDVDTGLIHYRGAIRLT
jgi:hypothetical protein